MAKQQRKRLLCFGLAVCLTLVCFSAFMIVGSASEGEGMSFSASNQYETTSVLPSYNSFTFEAEIYVDPKTSDTKRPGVIFGNYKDTPDSAAWGMEIHKYGTVRFYHKEGSIYFNINGSTNEAGITENDGTAADVRTYMGTASNPKYAKITVTINTESGVATLYINGTQIVSASRSFIKGKTFSNNIKHIVGGDYRTGNKSYFIGKTKNIALYTGVREDVAKSVAAFSPDPTDTSLLFAYDLTKAKDGFIEDLSAKRNHANDLNWTTTEGRGFDKSDDLYMEGTLAAMPRTYEAWIYTDRSVSRNGVIIGNYGSGNSVLLNFEIHSSGRPSVYIKCEDGLMDTKFDYNINRNAWAHLVITHATLENGGARFTCYVDGNKIGEFDTALDFEFDPDGIETFTLGRDSRSDNAQYFKGRMKDVALYSDVLTEAQIKKNYENGVDKSNASLLLHYELDGTDGQDAIVDSGKYGHDLHSIFYSNQHELELGKDYAYSMVVVGDTQKLVYQDAYNDTKYTEKIYNWIVENKAEKNIQFVMGLGDVTEKNGKDQTSDDGVDQTDKEWRNIVLEFKKLEAAGIPYSIIQGNHDTVAKLDEYFANNDYYTSEGLDIGYYSGNSLGNYYIRFTAGGNKYMVFGLEYGANDNILNWAGSVIGAEENKDYSVIITTHAYMYRDGTTLDMTDVVPPRKPNSTAESTSASYKNNGDQMWTKLASQYPNVIMVLSGHDPYANISMRSDLGVHGNTVYQFLIDFQSMDIGFSYETGMVAVFYFSADGKQVNVEYISTYRSLEKQAADTNSPDVIYNAGVNQFNFTIPEIVTLTDAECKYGTIPAYYSNEVTYPFVTFRLSPDGKNTFIGAFGDLGAATTAAKNDATASDYVVLMRRDAEHNSKSPSLISMKGDLTVDLGGYTLNKTAVGYVFDFYVNQNASGSTIDQRSTFTVMNGTVHKFGTGKPLVSFNYGTALNSSYSVTVNFNNLTFIDDPEYGGGYHILSTWEDGYSTGSTLVYANVNFNDCVFDYSSSIAGTEMIYLVNAADRDRCVYNVQINGGYILSDSAVTFTQFVKLDSKTADRTDKVTFGKGANGEYIQLVLPELASAPAGDIWTSGDGKTYYYAKDSVVSGDVYYKLTEGDADDYLENIGAMTKYGFVEKEFLDTSKYTVLVFKDNEFVGAYLYFCNNKEADSAFEKIKSITDGNADGEKGSVVDVLFIADSEYKAVHYNMGQILATVNVDLDGHKLIQTGGPVLLPTQAKNLNGMDDCTFNFFNGELVVKSSLLNFNAYGADYNNGEGYKTFHMNFNNVKFSFTEGSTSKNFLGVFEDGSDVYEKKVGYDVVFTNCVFDLTNAASLTTFLNANDPKITASGAVSVNSIVNVRIVGGEIIARNTNFTFADIHPTNGSSVTFETYDGKHLSLTVPKTEGMSDPEAPVEGIDLVFVKVLDNVSESTVTYRLRDKALADIDFVPKANITLQSELIFNVYIPANGILVKFTFCGVEYTSFEDLEKTVIDGKEYYVIRTEFPSSEAAKKLTLAATVNVNDGTATAKFTFGIVRYAELAIASGCTGAELKLVKDVLSYVKAAYAYFGIKDDETVADINAILGENYESENLPENNGSTAVPEAGLAAATFVLDAIPQIRFYLPKGASYESYSFYIGGEKLDCEKKFDKDYVGEGSGEYAEITLYAYMMCETIEYTVVTENGTVSGCYHILSYINWAKNEGNAPLAALAERFLCYCQSAKAYRESVVG